MAKSDQFIDAPRAADKDATPQPPGNMLATIADATLHYTREPLPADIRQMEGAAY